MKLIKISFLLIFLYSISWLVSYRTISNLPIHIIGLILILFIIPLNIMNIFNIKLHSLWENYICSILIFFMVYVPIFYIATLFLNIKINLTNLFLFSLLILFVSWLFSIRRRGDIFSQPKKQKPKLDKNEKLLILFIFIFFVIHGINFYFYKFIPEWDGYTNILNLEKILTNGLLINNYRPLYFTAMSILSSFARLTPYALYQTVMIGLQVNILIVLYLFIDQIKISKTWSKVIIYLSALSIPVLNMEIDMVRPQNTLIILLPIYFYLLFKAIKTNHKIYWTLTSLIAFLGPGFHEFFAFVMIIHIAWIFILLFNKYFLSTDSKQNKMIFVLTVLTIFLIIKDLFLKLDIYSSIIFYAQTALSHISNVSAWRWWFLSNYDTDGDILQMGWSGLRGLVKYYSYYLSPVMFLTLIILIWIVVKNKKNNTKNTIDNKLIYLTTIPPLVFYFILAEILPRMNFTLLPDRYWFMFDMTLLILLVGVFKIIENNKINYNKYLIVFTVIIIISMGGSFYVAKEKKSLTTKNDFVASQWILNNTPENAVFISQASNTPMVYYFARRKTLEVEKNYFMDDELKTNYLENKINNIKVQIDGENKRIQDAVDNINNKNDNDSISISIIEKAVKDKNLLAIKLQFFRDYINVPLYILYSDNKFSNLYDQRIWWKNVNYYGAKLEKFNYYPLVYNSNGVYIWKIK